MKTVEVYEAEDGTLHRTERDCHAKNLSIHVQRMVSCDSSKFGTASVVTFIVRNHSDVFKLLAKYQPLLVHESELLKPIK